MKRKKLYKRVFSVMMAAILLLAMLPQGTYAETKEPITINIRSGDFKPALLGDDNGATLLWGKGTGTVATNGSLFLTTSYDDNAYNLVVKRNKIKISNGFSTYFTMDITSGVGDGMTFFVQGGDDNGQPILGNAGGDLGYQSADNSASFGVEFDTYENENDPDGNHVAIVEKGSVTHSDSKTPSFSLASAGTKKHVWVDYKPNGDLTVTVNNDDSRSGGNAITLKKMLVQILLTRKFLLVFRLPQDQEEKCNMQFINGTLTITM